MVIGDVVQLGSEIVGIFKGKEPTPEEQQQKAGVWYSMLRDWTRENRTVDDTYQFAGKWQSSLPFSQNSTKQRFMDNNIKGNDPELIINVLVSKINDELVKGGFAPQSKEVILSGMGTNGFVVDSSINTSTSGSGYLKELSEIADDQNGQKESNRYFIVTVLLSVAALLIYFSSTKRKRRR